MADKVTDMVPDMELELVADMEIDFILNINRAIKSKKQKAPYFKLGFSSFIVCSLPRHRLCHLEIWTKLEISRNMRNSMKLCHSNVKKSANL